MDAARNLKANLKLDGQTCVACKTALKLGDDASVCTACDGAHHARCWTSYGGCATKACVNAPLRRLDNPSYDAPPVVTSTPARTDGGPTARCAICYTVLSDREAQKACPECHVDYHQSCWDQIGGCGSYGCKQAAVAQKPAVPVLVGAGWGDAKACPSCGAHIGSSMLMCGCGARFPWADPMTRSDYAAWMTSERARATARTALVWMFIFSLFGLTAPVVGPLAGVYAYRKRKQLQATGGSYLAMGYGSAAIGACYLVLALVLVAGG